MLLLPMKAVHSLYMAIPFAIAILACKPTPSTPPRANSASSAPPIAKLPVELTVNQRSTTAIPGSLNKLSITVDDVTRGQVMVSVVQTDAAPLLGPISMKEEDTQKLEVQGVGYTLRVTGLTNSLMGEDTVSVAVEASTSKFLSEAQKIDRLIDHIELMEKAIFVRNGEEHSARDAAKHLRDKIAVAGEESLTASDFIELIATRSSLSGEIYEIRFADGRKVPASDVLRQKLAEIEAEAGS